MTLDFTEVVTNSTNEPCTVTKTKLLFLHMNRQIYIYIYIYIYIKEIGPQCAHVWLTSCQAFESDRAIMWLHTLCKPHKSYTAQTWAPVLVFRAVAEVVVQTIEERVLATERPLATLTVHSQQCTKTKLTLSTSKDRKPSHIFLWRSKKLVD